MKEFFASHKLPEYAPIVARLGLAGVVIWFGTSQLMNQSMWTSFIPDWAMTVTFLSATKLVILNGIFEIIAGGLLAFGLFVRPVAALLFLHMAGIVVSVGLSPIGVRDAGIAAGLLSVALYGNDLLSWKSTTQITSETSNDSTAN